MASVSPSSKVILDSFHGDHVLYALPIVDDSEAPVALVDRRRHIEFFSKPYTQELLGRRSIASLTGHGKYPSIAPIIVEDSSTIYDIAHVIDSEEVRMKAHLKQPLSVIWDGSKPHRSRLVRDYLDSLDGHIKISFLPPYAPDLNPVQYLWAWVKRHAPANYCPNDLSELRMTERNKLKSAQKRPSIIAACWMQATLW